MDSSTTRRLTAMSSCAFACILVGTSFGAAHALTGYPFATGQALRYAVAAVALALVIRIRGRGRGVTPQARRILTARQKVRIYLVAATGAVGFNLAILAAERTAQPAVPGVVVGCSPLVVAVLVPMLKRRRPSPRSAAASGLVVAGAAVVQGFGHTGPAGLAFSLLALAGEVCFSLLAVPLLPVISPLVLSARVCTAAAIESAVIATLTGGAHAWQLPDASQAFALAWQALPVTVVAFCLWYAGLSHLGPERAQLFVSLMPIAAAGCAPLIGAGSLGFAQLAGSGLVGAGVILGSVQPAAKKRDHRLAATLAAANQAAATSRSPVG